MLLFTGNKVQFICSGWKLSLVFCLYYFIFYIFRFISILLWICDPVAENSNSTLNANKRLKTSPCFKTTLPMKLLDCKPETGTLFSLVVKCYCRLTTALDWLPFLPSVDTVRVFKLKNGSWYREIQECSVQKQGPFQFINLCYKVKSSVFILFQVLSLFCVSLFEEEQYEKGKTVTITLACQLVSLLV